MKKSVIWTLSGIAAAGLVGTGAAAWALAQPQTQAAPVDEEPQEGLVVADVAEVPSLYTGDELEWLIPEDDALAELFGATAFQEVLAEYSGTGEREGITARPEECDPFIWEDYTRVIGQRIRPFSVDDGYGSVRVMQFGTAEAAQEWAAGRLAASGTCETFEVGRFYDGGDEVFSHYSHTQLASREDADSTVVVDLLDVAEDDEWNADTVDAVMVHGNTVTVVFAVHDPAAAFDADRLIDVLESRAVYAHDQLEAALR